MTNVMSLLSDVTSLPADTPALPADITSLPVDDVLLLTDATSLPTCVKSQLTNITCAGNLRHNLLETECIVYTDTSLTANLYQTNTDDTLMKSYQHSYHNMEH